jgi:hypothetical protein
MMHAILTAQDPRIVLLLSSYNGALYWNYYTAYGHETRQYDDWENAAEAYKICLT